MNRLITALGLLLAVGSLHAAALRVPAEGLDEVQFHVEGGAALFSLYADDIRFEAVPGPGSDLVLEVADGRTGAGIPPVQPTLVREGTRARAVLDFGAFRMFRLGGGAVTVRLGLPAAFAGSLSAVLDQGTLAIRDLSLAELRASVGLGSLRLTQVQVGRLVLKTREAGQELTGVRVQDADLRSGLGPIRGRDLGGAWTVETSEGAVGLGFAGAPGPVDIRTGLGTVELRIPPSAAFRFEGRSRLWKPRADFPLVSTEVPGFLGGQRLYSGETGTGGPLVKVETREGGIEVRRP